MSTTIPATPMPNATGTETQPAPMVEVKALEWTRPHGSETLHRAQMEWGTYRTWTHHEANGVWFWEFATLCGRSAFNGEGASETDVRTAAQADFERRVLACLHPAPATPADETLRAEVERLTKERDEARAQFEAHDELLHQCIDDRNAYRKRAIQGEAERDEATHTLEFVEKHLTARAEAAEAKLAALSQPAPVVEDGTARDEVLRVVLAMHAIRDGEHGDVPQSVRGFINATLDTFPPAPEGQNAEASLRAAIEKALRSITYQVSTEIRAEGYDLMPRKNIVYGVELLFAARATAPAVPDGRTKEVEDPYLKVAGENIRLREELAWYGEQARLARLIHSEGDAGRHALAADGGKRALAALSERRT